MNNPIRFNTGRGYTAEGQRIAVIRYNEEWVMFEDIDRNVGGFIRWPEEMEKDLGEIDQGTVMNVYDKGGFPTSAPDGEHDRARGLRDALTEFAKGGEWEDPDKEAESCMSHVTADNIVVIVRALVIGGYARTAAYGEILNGHFGFDRDYFGPKSGDDCQWVWAAIVVEYGCYDSPQQPVTEQLADWFQENSDQFVFVIRKLVSNPGFREEVRQYLATRVGSIEQGSEVEA